MKGKDHKRPEPAERPTSAAGHRDMTEGKHPKAPVGKGDRELNIAAEVQVDRLAKLRDALGRLDFGDHLCLIYRDPEEQLAAVIPFIRQGLANKEKCLYIADERTADEVRKALDGQSVDVPGCLGSGQLTIITREEAYLRGGYFDPDEMISLLTAATEEAVQEGYRGLRVTGEMTWVFAGMPGSERLIEYEAKLNRFFPGSKALAICQYHESRFPPDLLLDVLATHPLVIVGDLICRNSYYVPPDEFLLSKRDPALEYRRYLNQIREREQAEETVRTSEESLARAQEVANLGSWDWNIVTNELPWSDQIYRIFGLKPQEFGATYEAYLDCVLPADREFVKASVNAALYEGERYSIDHRIVRKDGTERVVHEQAEVIYDGDGKAVRMVGTVQDITERKRAEEIIAAQARAILELSTPVVEIREGVLILPLIGTIDTQRAQQIMENLLGRIVETSATTVLLDLTGVPVVDTEVANHLIRTAQAARLLGARPVLTGIRPEIAQTLVHLGVDLGSIETCGSLKDFLG